MFGIPEYHKSLDTLHYGCEKPRAYFVPFSDEAAALEFIRRLSAKFTDDTDYVEREIREAMDHTLIFTLTPEHITGKITKES